MKHSIRPTRTEVEKIRSKIRAVLDTYGYALELENPEIIISWQILEQDFSVISVKDNTIQVAVDPKASNINLTDDLLRGLLEAEFNSKNQREIQLKWEELAKFVYVAKRFNEITGEELIKKEEIKQRWPEIKEKLGEDLEEHDRFFYLNTGIIGETLAAELEEYEAEEIPKMSKTDFEKMGEQL